jgi:hypothetical protein
LEKKSKVTENLLKAFKVIFRLVLSLVFGLVLVAVLLQIPYIQTRISNFLTSYISDNTGFRTNISNVSIRWWDAVSLKDVVIYDQKDSLMVNLEEVFIDFSVSGILNKNNPSIDQINLQKGNVRLLSHPGEKYINISEFFLRVNQLFITGEKDPNRKPIRVDISNINLDRTSFDIINYAANPVEEGFDYNELLFRNLTADADDFYTQEGVIAFKLNSLKGVESNSGIVFQQLKTDFTYAPTYIEFDNLLFRSNNTVIKDYLKFGYDSPAALSNFNKEVMILARLDESALDIKDLQKVLKPNP